MEGLVMAVEGEKRLSLLRELEVGAGKQMRVAARWGIFFLLGYTLSCARVLGTGGPFGMAFVACAGPGAAGVSALLHENTLPASLSICNHHSCHFPIPQTKIRRSAKTLSRHSLSKIVAQRLTRQPYKHQHAELPVGCTLLWRQSA